MNAYIPVKYVAQDSNNQLSVQLENEGPIIYWTPADSGDPNWQSTPSQDDGFELEDIRVTPIHSDETTVTVTPMPEEKDWRDAILVFPESSGIAPLYVVYKESPRDKPGTVTGHGENIDGIWLEKASEGLGSPIPSQVADKLRGREFSSFDAFRKAFWKATSETELSSQFTPSNQERIRQGFAPFPRFKDQVGGRQKYEIHHKIELQHGDSVYELDNMAITTPENHIRIHSKAKG
ncbi:S-type pyocin domain-containing protein [uncultured Vibrio sp.]|uniref:S-type pyocin domain-containing protein n=1 Tax=uncultured Vibrio sp. TaxID=114054 RepID=UPI002615588C|nr:S-type pyocin domain-containing protein [uncultured Vibrio sp.]